MFGGGHAWVRITLSNGEIMIMDPAQRYCGLLKDAGERSRGWAYDRPEDVEGEGEDGLDINAQIIDMGQRVENILELTGYQKTKGLKASDSESVSDSRLPIIVGSSRSLFKIEKVDEKWTITNLSPGFKGLSKTIEPAEYGATMTFGRYVNAVSGPAFQSDDAHFSREHFTVSFQKDEITIAAKPTLNDTEVWELERKKEDATPDPDKNEENIRARVAEKMAAEEYEFLTSLPPRKEGAVARGEKINSNAYIGHDGSFFNIIKLTTGGWRIANDITQTARTILPAEYGRPFVFGRAAEDPALKAVSPGFSREHFSITFTENECVVFPLSTKKPTEIWVHRERQLMGRMLPDQESLDSFTQEFAEALKKELQLKHDVGFRFDPPGFAGKLKFVRGYAQQFLTKYTTSYQLYINESVTTLLLTKIPLGSAKKNDVIGLLTEYFVIQYAEGKLGFY